MSLDKPTKKITTSALKSSIDSLEKPVSDGLYSLILRLCSDQSNVLSDNGEEVLEGNDYVKYVGNQYHNMRDMLLDMSNSSQKFLEERLLEIKGEAANDTNYLPIINISDLGKTAIFLQRAKEIVDTNLQISEDDKTELLAAGKNALEEMANIAKKRGWGEMDIPELKFKEPLGVVEPSNVMEVK